MRRVDRIADAERMREMWRREQIAEAVTLIANRQRHAERKSRRAARRHKCRHWLNPFVQVVSDVGRMP